MHADVIIQARMGSTRLPGKVLMKINGKSVLECLLEQLKYSKHVNRIFLATTNEKNDNIIEDFANRKNIPIFRGNSFDVLDRYYFCSKKFSIKNIVRITADNPLIDPTVIDKVIELYISENLDYANNFDKRTFPHGCEIEVFSFNALEKTWKEAITPYEREHVTPYIYHNKDKFKTNHLENIEDLSDFSWTLDTINDFEKIKNLYQKISKHPILIQNIISMIEHEENI